MLTRIARVLMNEVDASPGGGAAASTPSTPDAQAKEPAAPVAPAITLEAIAELLEKQKNSVEANTRRMIEGALGKTKKSEPARVDSPNSGVPATNLDAEQWATFNRKAGALGLSDSQIDRAAKAIKAELPDDVGAWLGSYVSDLGIKPAGGPAQPNVTQNHTPSATPQATPAPAAQPAPSHPAPTGSTPPTIPGSDPLKWTKSQRDAYLRSKAAVPHDLYDRKNRAMWREGRRLYENAMATVRVLPPDE